MSWRVQLTPWETTSVLHMRLPICSFGLKLAYRANFTSSIYTFVWHPLMNIISCTVSGLFLGCDSVWISVCVERKCINAWHVLLCPQDLVFVATVNFIGLCCSLLTFLFLLVCSAVFFAGRSQCLAKRPNDVVDLRWYTGISLKFMVSQIKQIKVRKPVKMQPEDVNSSSDHRGGLFSARIIC